MTKKSFVLYSDLLNLVDKLPDESAGKLFKIILQYVNDVEICIEDLLLKIAFEPIKNQLERDFSKWDRIKTRRSEAGKQGGRPRNEEVIVVSEVEEKAKKANAFSEKQTKAKKANAFSEKQTKAKKAVNVNDNVNVNVNVNDNVNVNVNDNVNVNVIKDKNDKSFFDISKEISSEKLQKNNFENFNFEQIIKIFNETCARLPQIQKITQQRKIALRNRISEVGFSGLGEIFQKVAESDFLNGENDKGWTCDFDWILKPANFQKISENKYKNKINATQQSKNQSRIVYSDEFKQKIARGLQP